ncbi:MAG: protein-disulfide reductase DsbD [Azoarcus sp.]|jgi:thiol:disulfide interchange protein DsbD|nr:protein-disulfide reductase DsbD [Azoarcus sp.]
MPIAAFFRLPFLLLALALSFAATTARAGDPLDPEQAFAVSARALGPDSVEVTFNVARGYYLYGERFGFATKTPGVTLGEAQRPPGERHMDQFFGEVETYRGQLRVLLPVTATEGTKRFTLEVTGQGCWDGGVCYPPLKQEFDIDLTGSASGGAGSSLLAGALNRSPDAGSAVAADAAPGDSGDESGRLARLLADADLALVLASFFGLGLLLAFTPCTLPMIPILSGIVVGAGHRASRARAAALSLAYVLGMATTYALAGVAAGLTGTLLAAALQNVWVLSAFALVFVVLALSMFGLYELQLPAALQSRLSAVANREKGGHLGGVAAMGAVSALIVGPCVTAPLAGALLYIAKTGDAVLGGVALFVLALGMGVPLIALALTAHSVLPKAGPWMEWVKRAAGVLLLAAAVWIISPLLPSFSGVATHPPFTRVATVEELDAKLAETGGRAAMLDFYADWCVTCKEMERDTFSDPEVAARMARMLLLQVDVTDYTEAHKALLQRFGLVGPPGIVFFDASGRRIDALRVVGFMKPREFAALLDRAQTALSE